MASEVESTPEEDSELDLGFLKTDTPAWKLGPRFFPSKVGGQPAWLQLEHLPAVQARACGVCGVPTAFLAQVYAPISELAPAFHRTLFLWVCPDPQCHGSGSTGPWRVFRSQLPRRNDYYPFEAPLMVRNPLIDVWASQYGRLCRICGGAGAQACAACQKVGYCCRQHQSLDWKAGHRQECGQADFAVGRTRAQFGFPEAEIEIEPAEVDDLPVESDEEDEADEADEAEEAEEEDEVSEQMADLKVSPDPKAELELDQLSADQKTDKHFTQFLATTANAPDQVLRYERGGHPLWMGAQGQLRLADVPPCELCGQSRVFEFQIMPQLLTHLQLDRAMNQSSLDWGILAVYTCKASCDLGSAYKSEFIHCQMPPST